MLRQAIRLSGVTHLALTKLDVLVGFHPLRICVGYAGQDGLPSRPDVQASLVPVYEEHPGWDEVISDCQTWDQLPAAARAYVERIEALAGVPVALLGTGPGRDSVIHRGAPLDAHRVRSVI